MGGEEEPFAAMSAAEILPAADAARSVGRIVQAYAATQHCRRVLVVSACFGRQEGAADDLGCCRMALERKVCTELSAQGFTVAGCHRDEQGTGSETAAVAAVSADAVLYCGLVEDVPGTIASVSFWIVPGADFLQEGAFNTRLFNTTILMDLSPTNAGDR